MIRALAASSALVATVAVAACGKDAAPAPAPVPPNNQAPSPTDLADWQCFVADPRTPVIEAGNVTHSKERIVGDTFDTVNVNVRRGVYRVSRFTYKKVGDVFEDREPDGTRTTIQLLTPDGRHQMLHFKDPSGWEFSDETVIDDASLTVTSTDYDEAGKPIKSSVRHVRAPCYVVDAEIARRDSSRSP